MDFRRRLPEIRWQPCLSPVPRRSPLAGRPPGTVTSNGADQRHCPALSIPQPGWRVGWVLASPDLTGSIRKVHDFLTVGAAAPLQQAGVHALGLGLPERYYTQLSQEYAERRDHLLTRLQGAGFKSFMPHGAYYFMTDISSFGFADDASFVRHLITHVGVAAVPGSSFFPM